MSKRIDNSVVKLDYQHETIPSGYSYDKTEKYAYPPLEELTDIWYAHVESEAEYHELMTKYQNFGVSFILERKRVILGDSIGSGKTVQALIAADSQSGSILYVTKKTLINQVKEEVYKWCWSTIVSDYYIPQDKHILIINYEALSKLDPKSKWDFVIFDEAHLIKNRDARRSALAARLASKSKYLVLMTGTPIEKDPSDLWHLMHMLDHHKYSSYWRWYNYFIDFTEITNRRGDKIKINETPKNIDILHKLLKPYYLRRVFDRSEPQFITINVELYLEQRKIYKLFDKENYIAKYDKEISNELTRQVYLRQIATDPSGLVGKPVISIKIDAVMELLADLPLDSNVVIFSSFRQPVQRLHTLLGDTSYLYLDCPDKPLDNIFDSSRYLLSTFSALGTGANLQKADICVIMDLSSSSTVLRQAIGRIKRMGQTKQPIFYILHALDTVDQHINDLLEIKQENFKNIVIEKES